MSSIDPTSTLAFDQAVLDSATSQLAAQFGSSELVLRPLASTDYTRGHLTLLSTLTKAPDIGQHAWLDRFNDMVSASGTYYPLVIVDPSSDMLVATGTLLVERKFLRNAGLVGHIEDISVSPSQQGKGLGKLLILALTALSEQLGCYKSILDCDPKNETFYIKCGFENKGFEMAKYAAA